MGKRLGASRRMPNLSENSDRLENKEYYIQQTDSKKESANNPCTNSNEPNQEGSIY